MFSVRVFTCCLLFISAAGLKFLLPKNHFDINCRSTVKNTLTSIAGTPSNNLRELVLPETQKTSSKPTDKNSRGYHSSSVSRWSCLVLLKQFREIFLISEIISSLPFIRLIIVCDSGRRGSSACLSSGSLVISMNPHRGENVPKFTSPPNLNQPKMGAGKCSGK